MSADTAPASEARLSAGRCELATGDRVAGRYAIVRCVGRGGMGVVYEALDEVLGRPVALKLVLHRPEVSAAHHDRLEREARAAARLHHPNVIAITDFGRTAHGAYLAMELLRGESLSVRLARKGRLREAEAVDLVLQALDGLAAAHVAGMVHRDLKPANLFTVPLADRRLLLKVLDFGIVKLREQSTSARLTATGVQLGTPAYMAPEQLLLEEVDARTDVHAMGVTLYELLTGRGPFAGDGPVPTAHRVTRGDYQDLALANPELSSGTCAVVRRALSTRPDGRYRDAGEMRDALRAATHAGQEPPSVFPPPTRAKAGAVDREAATVGAPGRAAATPRPRRATRAWAAVAAGGCIALLTGIVLWWAGDTVPGDETEVGETTSTSPTGRVGRSEEAPVSAQTRSTPADLVPVTPASPDSAVPEQAASSAAAQAVERSTSRVRREPPRRAVPSEAEVTPHVPRTTPVLPEEPGILNPFDR